MIPCLYVALGGAVGCTLRYAVGVAMHRYTQHFPYETFLVNIVSCFLIGCFALLSFKTSWFTGEYKLLLMTGFCGGLSTFAAFSIQVLKQLQNGNFFMAGVNILANVIGCMLTVWLGYTLASLCFKN